jgi:hypothetical protein
MEPSNMVPLKRYEDWTVFSGELFLFEDGDIESPVIASVSIDAHTPCDEVFAFYWRTISHYLAKGNWCYFSNFGREVFNPFEESLGNIQVQLQTIGTPESLRKLEEYRREFNNLVAECKRLMDTRA